MLEFGSSFTVKLDTIPTLGATACDEEELISIPENQIKFKQCHIYIHTHTHIISSNNLIYEPWQTDREGEAKWQPRNGNSSDKFKRGEIEAMKLRLGEDNIEQKHR